jgi:NAD-dependent dihydropyrimidine dehydrogenase PreA subunit
MKTVKGSNATPTPDGVCRQKPGDFRPFVDRNACEGRGDCVRVCPVSVFAVDTLPRGQRRGLGFKGRIKGFAHRWQQALLINPEACEACGLCVEACPERALTLVRAGALLTTENAGG